MPYAKIRDLELYYEIHGPENAEPMLLHSGAFGVIGPDSDWSYQLPRFAQEYRVIIPEHRGHGRTNNPANQFTGYDVLADDVIGLLDYLEIPKAHMVGFSDGGITLLDLAQRYPERVDMLVSIGANYCNDEMVLTTLNNLHPDYIEQNYPDWAATLEKQHAPGGVGYWKTLALQLRAMWMHNPDFTPEGMSRITVPTLVMTGQYDPYGNLNQTLTIHQSIKGSELCILPGVAHPVMIQRPEVSTLIVLDYLSRQRRKRQKKSKV